MESKASRAKGLFKNIFTVLSRRVLFFGKNSGIHGLKQIFDENANFISRLFWIVIVLISSGCLYMILVPVVELGNQVNFTPDTLYLTWETTFPAVTVCEAYNYKKAQDKLKQLYPKLMGPLNFGFSKHLTELTYGLGTCSKSCVPCGTEVPCDVPWREIMEKVHQKCTEMLDDCQFNGQHVDCCHKFRLVDSEYGSCFSFNTLQSENSADEPLYTVNRSTGPGLLKFRVLYDAQLIVIATYAKSKKTNRSTKLTFRGIIPRSEELREKSVSVHSPEELATNVLDIKFKFDVKNAAHKHIQYLFSLVEMDNDPVLLAEDIDLRGCRKLDEIPEGFLHNYPVYSYGACRLAEDTEHLFEYCGCVHPVRHNSYKDYYCNFTGISCTYATKVQISKLGLDKHEHHDDCLPSCVESELSTIHISSQFRTPDDPKNISRGTMVTIRMASLPTLRYKRSLVRTNLDFVVSIGGMVSLFFAASILSIAEIVYLIFRSQK